MPDTLVSNLPPQTPLPNIPAQAPAVPSPTLTQPSPRRPFWLFAVLSIVLLSAATYYFAHFLNPPNNSAPSSPTPSTQPEVVIENTGLIVSDSRDSLVYIKNTSTDSSKVTNEVWLINPSTRQEQKLDLPVVAEAYKHPASTEVWYRVQGDQIGEIRVLDLSSGQEQRYTPITHPQVNVYEQIGLGGADKISPDGKWAFITVEYYEECPPPSPFPSGVEGGFGPCMPDENLEYPYGVYLFERAKNKATPLDSGFVRLSDWDPVNQTLYYINGDKHATYKVDLTNRSREIIDSSSDFGYFTYPLLKSNQLLRFTGQTGSSTGKAYSEVAILDLATQKKEPIDGEDSWAEIQPFLSASPNETHYFITRSPFLEPHSSGRRKEVIISYNPQDKSLTPFTPSDENVSIRPLGYWISDTHFVAQSSTIDINDSSKTEFNLVLLDFTDTSVTPLTTHGRVFSFGGQ
ncbi:hypothetical protein DCC61_03985 [Candidatus Microgenomates bacterium]|nr:hypothetical protein [Candidatus Microgenomates bacterium CPR3]RIK50992.1 MAG: hypothetical protein DCC61_03985 [Candidatus Microgenomates bacterium]